MFYKSLNLVQIFARDSKFATCKKDMVINMKIRLETDRLIMRNFDLTDERDALEYLSDEQTMYYVEDPFDIPQTREFIEECGMCEPPYVYALELKETKKVIGHIIFHEYNQECIYELGFIINRNYHRKGYAYEICKELINYAFTELQVHKIVAETIAPNSKSRNLLEKLGFIKEGIFRQHNFDHEKWEDEYHYGLLSIPTQLQ